MATACIFLILPWINPLAPGPSPAVVPLIVSGACAAALLVLSMAFPGQFSGRRLVLMSAYAWLAAGLISAAIGLYQYFGAGGSLLPWVNQARLGEAFANLRQRNQFASLTNIALTALIWLVLRFNPKPLLPTRDPAWSSLLVFVAAGLLTAGTAASSSRTGLLQLALLCLLCCAWGLWRHPPLRRLLMVSAASYTVATFALPWLAGLDLSVYGLAARLQAGDAACVSRLTLWSNVIKLIALKPWTGWGLGELDYAHYMTLYEGPRFCEILDNAHNLPLNLAVELGIPAALAICGGFIAWVIRRCPWAETDPGRQLAWSVLAVILVHSMLEYPLWYGPFQMAAVLCVAILWRREGDVDMLAATQVGVRSPRAHLSAVIVQGLAAAALMVASVYATWDYHRVSQIYLSPSERDAAYRNETMEKIQNSWLFSDQVRFAQLLITPLTHENASWTLNTALSVLHYSPEPRVAEKIIESSVMLGLDTEALQYLTRYRAAFPDDYARWAKTNAEGVSAPRPAQAASR